MDQNSKIDSSIPNTIFSILACVAASHPEQIAILGDDVRVSYAQLNDHLRNFCWDLRGFGIGRHSRIAIVMPNGPLAASTFLAVASAAIAAPLNPGYRKAEFEFFLSDLKADALIILSGMPSPAREVAAERGIRLLEITDRAGLPQFCQVPPSTTVSSNQSSPNYTALILHTSGTTARPKIVPLTHANLCASANNIQRWLNLSPTDRCLNVMPMFHIHGLIGALLSSMAAGASVVCAKGFIATEFFGWLREYKPTWYTAVPTMHQSIVARAESENLDGVQLQFVRSASSAFPPQVAEALERVFHAPTIEAYGMTEGSHQMCSNPLPPASRKFGSVGKPAGMDVAIMNAAGDLLASGQSGEVAIRGINVTVGYENNPQANESSFAKGWFRTGDLGHFDKDGYLFLAGRLKELINRGGEKISPREIDEVLLDHPAVSAAVTFGIPDPTLGEEIAAAIVLRKNAQATDWELMRFASARLADFKVPRQIIILDEIPKGPTGKPQRIGLAKTLGLDSPAQKPKSQPIVESDESLTKIENTLREIWSLVLKIPSIGKSDNFLKIGGDSILASQVVARVREQTGAELPMWAFFKSPTLREMAAFLRQTCPDILLSKQPPEPIKSDEDDLAAILSDIEAMSDDDARSLLAGSDSSHQ
jgi:acyl-CoA synthetase (AMP-forming)/AMP-acid ligase II